MPRCHSCQSMIVFGGERVHSLHFCNNQCRTKGLQRLAETHLPAELVHEHTLNLHRGECPICQGEGPVDLHQAYWVGSALYFSRFGSTAQVSCRRCARWSQLRYTFQSLGVGWWALPGIFMTPIQVLRNVFAMFSPPHPHHPSPRLQEFVKLRLIEEALSHAPPESTDPDKPIAEGSPHP